jgi:organic hydroperoxide reductase OsmC/OhrA
MSEHVAEIVWKRTTESFAYDDYSRTHDVKFDNGLVVKAAASPDYRGDPACVDPEELFVAALSNCHMLTFLAICAKKRLVVDSYMDRAVGRMEKNAAGKVAVTHVDLNPRVVFAPGVAVDRALLEKLHHDAHDHCFIANSATTEVAVRF